ncbi:glycoside hydrolase family 25 protein [Elizabethkingia argentiflava]|uniref:Glycoside hydrolase family 25 protein n=1 Tax=Elizabethkingia argenteiflava TaxID=2681556 RepID=A0A845PVL1_9FLAO|nr:GH25 family lysozyme [Elizabethkingia argenteiflava]NAW50517.1 glycoside hydrolase family 25 protein [Elizabethkingia argenteiflava]
MYKKAPRKRRKRMLKKRASTRKKLWVLFFILITSLLAIGFYMKNQMLLYYAIHFKSEEIHLLKNTKLEEDRIHRIVSLHVDKTFGIDISHYQRKKDINWHKLTMANGAINIQFILLRASMGENAKDHYFQEYWKSAKRSALIRGAYHFYRPRENPVQQANNFLETVKLESGDLLPVLDVEKIPSPKKLKEFKNDLKVWLKIVEETYGKKPIIYTYYYFYRDYLQDDFKDYPLWLANYNDVDTPAVETLWDFWQFTEKGIINGVNTHVDVNIFNGNLSELHRLTLD